MPETPNTDHLYILMISYVSNKYDFQKIFEIEMLIKK